MKSALLSIASTALFVASVSTQTVVTINTPLVSTIFPKNCFLTLEPEPMWWNVNLFNSPGVVVLVSVFAQLLGTSLANNFTLQPHTSWYAYLSLLANAFKLPPTFSFFFSLKEVRFFSFFFAKKKM
jgi:hypothetical protein